MKALHEIKSMLCRELEMIAEKGELTAGDLETTHKLTDTIKNIDKIMMLEDGDYSRDDYSMHGRGDWEARGNYGGSNSYARHGRRYSMEDGKSRIISELESLMHDADGKHRDTIRRAIDEVKSI